MQLNKQ